MASRSHACESCTLLPRTVGGVHAVPAVRPAAQSFLSGRRTLMDNFDYVMHGKVRGGMAPLLGPCKGRPG